MTREELLQIAKPILFNTDMVRAILDGRKTVTRRVIKPKYRDEEGGFRVCTNKATGERWVEKMDLDEGSFDNPRYVKPPYQPGDILYVRETWYKGLNRILYKANYSENEKFYTDGKEIQIKWHPSIHMPKEAARIWLKVKEVRVERLQDAKYFDYIHEGLSYKQYEWEIKEDFQKLWNSTIKNSDIARYGWDANPWVWVIEFERCEKPEGWCL